MSAKRSWKVYGREGHCQEMAFEESVFYDFSEAGCTRKLWFDCEDKTGTAEYVLVTIECDTPEECEKELWEQITDGYFEDSHVGNVVEIPI